MNIEKYLEDIKNIQQNILDFVSKDDNTEEKYQNLIKIITNDKIQNDKQEIKIILHLILKISDNHYRAPNFFDKIEKILLLFKEQIQKIFTNLEIFNFFKDNKMILLFLIKEQILKIDNSIFSNEKFEDKSYQKFFFPEIKSFLPEKEIQSISKDIPKDFEEKRKIGENDNHYCELIRKDLIDEFISFINQKQFPLNSKVDDSIFETNSFLIENKPNLIEYAAFFGSIQIFKYLYKNKDRFTKPLWYYAIHSDNAELISLLEENKVSPKNDSYIECIEEAIKCHHNDMKNYVQTNFLQNDDEESSQFLSKIIQYFNFAYLQKEDIDNDSLIEFCKFDYYPIVKLLLQNKKIDVNYRKISNQ